MERNTKYQVGTMAHRGSRNQEAKAEVLGLCPEVREQRNPGSTRSQGLVLVVEMSELSKPEEDLQEPDEAQGPEEAQLLGAEGGEATSLSASSPPVSSSAPVVALPQEALNIMVAKMVKFLLHKYRAKEPTSYAELLNTVLRDNQEHYPVVFCQAFECILLVFGVEMKEVDPRKHIHIMVPNLGLTCDAMQRGGQGLPKVGLLVVVFSLILQNSDCSPEEEIWEALNKMGLYVGREHSMFGEPRELLTQVWVQEGYLKYRQVPNSDPVRYEFLWGPRAFLETSKEKFMEYLLKVN
ncbi:melanoma-associated antigen 9-like [Muntiacus reevesi]|uniref:melanoma-associated antigen 9-like n=1 Tax=Muntiacus reevesi TaxID=9886 RepID=UPI003306DCCA